MLLLYVYWCSDCALHARSHPTDVPATPLWYCRGVVGNLQADELAKAAEGVAVLKAQLASEKETNTTHIEQLESSARAAAQTAEAKQMDLHDDILSLQEQVRFCASP
jgi:hypothetical protein